jgi:hypothetical protein
MHRPRVVAQDREQCLRGARAIRSLFSSLANVDEHASAVDVLHEQRGFTYSGREQGNYSQELAG